MCEEQCCTILHDATTYNPDTFDLYKDSQAADYWFQCFRSMITKFSIQAEASQHDYDDTAAQRAEQFRLAYLQKIEEYQQCAARERTTITSLGTRELLGLNEILLRRYGFPDPWKKQKQMENEAALALLEGRLKELDALDSVLIRWTELVRGVLAGNMFDWGAQAVTEILENDKTFGLHSALERIERRPWLMDDLDAWLDRIQKTAVHRCALIFVDNSGVDVVLGILPFARELLKRGTKVLLAANTEPSLNDVTSGELRQIIESSCNHCRVLREASDSRRLLVFENGQYGPCLDMRTLPVELCEAIVTNETDLLVIEGMGRALHTNLHAKFCCETLKLAAIKNKWLANRLGGDTFAVMCKYES